MVALRAGAAVPHAIRRIKNSRSASSTSPLLSWERIRRVTASVRAVAAQQAVFSQLPQLARLDTR